MELKTERLVLRDFVPDDLDAYFAVQSDPRWLEFYEWTERKREDAQELMQRFIDFQHEQPRVKFQLAITLDGRLIGSCGARMDEPLSAKADIGYEVHPDHWGHGYATEAAKRMVRFAFEDLDCDRVWSWCIADNVRSARVLEKAGLRLEERRPDTDHFKGRSWDTLVFGVIRETFVTGAY